MPAEDSKRSLAARVLLTASLVAAGTTHARAQQVIGVASFDFCRVFIVTCNQIPEDACPPQFDGGMAAGQRFTSNTGRLCFKRDNNPGDCASGLTTEFRCTTRTISGSEETSIN